MMQPPFETDQQEGRMRNSAKALINEEAKILLTVNKDRLGDFYLLPGGGQKFGETLHQALLREVLEETGWVVKAGDLLLVRDYIGANHEFAEEEGDVHQTEFIFACTTVHLSDGPLLHDTWQIGVEWVDTERLQQIRIYPSLLSKVLPLILSGEYSGPIYLGDSN